MTTGRPTVMDDDIKAAICSAIADGATVRQIAAQENMPAASTIYLALAKDEAFSDQYARAREAQLERWEDEILEIADDATNDWMLRERDGEETEVPNAENVARSKLRVDARKWLMSKRLPRKYGDRVTQEITGKDGGPVLLWGSKPSE